MTGPSSADDALREHLLADGQLNDAQRTFLGVIRVWMATREKARLTLFNEVWNFRLAYSSDPDAYDGEKVLLCTTPRNVTRHDFANTLHWDYIWHRAAEAMLAVRQGQLEARLATQKRKLLREQKKSGAR